MGFVGRQQSSPRPDPLYIESSPAETGSGSHAEFFCRSVAGGVESFLARAQLAGFEVTTEATQLMSFAEVSCGETRHNHTRRKPLVRVPIMPPRDDLFD